MQEGEVPSSASKEMSSFTTFINSAPSCNCFGRHGEWKKIMATKIIKKVAKLASVPSVK